MPTLVHLSDLHFLAEPDAQGAIFDSLVAALEQDRAARGVRADLLAITGDVFNSSTLDTASAVAQFTALYDRIDAALGGSVPAVILPGNHDRRDLGVIGPNDEKLFRALRDALSGRAYVHGCDTPFLAHLVPAAYHQLPVHLVAYDSTYLSRGLMSAGGVVRQEDLLRIADQIAEHNDERPVVLLLHHHLIPTPLTDVAQIESQRSSTLVRWAVDKLLPALVAHGDKEELTMTALGAGTALSTLHALGRAVLVLHGHKHYPTARVLRATAQGEGDLLLASAGSAGTTQQWNPTGHPEAPRLWPSFNLVHLEGERVWVETVSFSHKEPGHCVPPRALASAVHAKGRWEVTPVPAPAARTVPDFELNEAVYALEPSSSGNAGLWDVACERRLRPTTATQVIEYPEFVAGIAGAAVTNVVRGGVTEADASVPAKLDLALLGVTSYRLRDGVCRTVGESMRRFADGDAFEWVALLNRYPSERARLVLLHPDPAARPFGSITDLSTGQERPMRVTREDDRAVLACDDCPPRTLLRIYWALERDERAE